uniref:B-cell receptor-associated protein n=1 Tax=Equus asinus TaxID=9793 RepID=A0A8C4PT30_EQUAS
MVTYSATRIRSCQPLAQPCCGGVSSLGLPPPSLPAGSARWHTCTPPIRAPAGRSGLLHIAGICSELPKHSVLGGWGLVRLAFLSGPLQVTSTLPMWFRASAQTGPCLPLSCVWPGPRPSLLRRLVTLISQQATLLASNEAFKKQAESASEAAKKYMEENDQLKKETAVGGVKLDGRDAEVKAEEENRSLKADLKKLKDELAISKQKLEKAENEVLAMRKQSEGLTKEYDRLLEEHTKLQAAVDGPTDKKEE